MAIVLSDLSGELLLSISDVLEEPDIFSLMQSCRGIYLYLRDVYNIRKFRTVCARNSIVGRPSDTFWALNDLLKSVGPDTDPSRLLPFFKASLSSLKELGFEELLIPIAQACATGYKEDDKESQLLEWIWDQFHPRPLTLLPVAQRLYDLSQTDGMLAELEGLRQLHSKSYDIKLVPYTISKPRSGGRWDGGTMTWRHTGERGVVVAMSKKPRLYRRFLKSQRRREELWLRRLERKGPKAAGLERRQRMFEVMYGFGLDLKSFNLATLRSAVRIRTFSENEQATVAA